jgi:GT2 family glycosyltransferase
MNGITVGIKTFIRVTELERAMESLVGRGFAQVLVADDSHMDETRLALYRRFENRLPLRVLELPFRSGISYGRNRMVEACTTPYFLLLDGDTYLDSDISTMLEVLESCPQLGAVTALEKTAGKFYSSAGNLYKFGSFIVLDVGFGPHRKARRSPAGTPYHTYEMVGNFALFRTEVFEDVKWDEAIVAFREHMDFYLAHKALGKWQFALIPGCTFGHGSSDSGEFAALYNHFRFDAAALESMINYFKNKWGMSHAPKRRGPKAILVHSLVFIGRIFQRNKRA